MLADQYSQYVNCLKKDFNPWDFRNFREHFDDFFTNSFEHRELAREISSRLDKDKNIPTLGGTKPPPMEDPTPEPDYNIKEASIALSKGGINADKDVTYEFQYACMEACKNFNHGMGLAIQTLHDSQEINRKTHKQLGLVPQKIPSIVFDDSPLAKELRGEIAKTVCYLLDISPLDLRKYVGNYYQQEKALALNTIKNESGLSLPDPETGNYERWANRDKSKDETAIEFFNRVWGDYVKAGVLYQTDLRGEQHGDNRKKGLDSRLYDLLRREYKEKLTDILPNRSARVTDVLKASIKNRLVA